MLDDDRISKNLLATRALLGVNFEQTGNETVEFRRKLIGNPVRLAILNLLKQTFHVLGSERRLLGAHFVQNAPK